MATSLTWESAGRRLPGVPESMHEGDLLAWKKIPIEADTVDVVWVRLKAGLKKP